MCRTKRYALLLTFIALLCSCADVTTRIIPANSADAVSGIRNAAKDSAAGVKITVQTAGWPGDAEIEDTLQPIRIILENRSGRPILITYDKFALLGPWGRKFTVLSPFEIKGTPSEPEVMEKRDPVPEPMVILERFEIVPEYGRIYPDVPILEANIHADTIYHGGLPTSPSDSATPFPEVARRALPEGVLQEGGWLDGYLFFEKIPEDLAGVSFRAQLVDLLDGRVIGTLSIPFKVDRERS